MSLRFLSDVRLFAPGSERPVEVEVTAARDGAAGTLDLEAPAGWRVAPESQPFRLAAVGDRAQLAFTVTAPAQAATAGITARAQVGDATCSSQRVVIRHDHIPLQLLQPPARLKAVALELAIRGQRVGYMPGAGDSVAESLEEMGYAVTPLTGADLTPERLRGLDAVVIGVRALQRPRRPRRAPAGAVRLRRGGRHRRHAVQPAERARERPGSPRIDLRLSDARVTDENAPVTFLAPDHPALNTPNKITDRRLRGLGAGARDLLPDQWDEHFTPILACSDPGEAPLKGGLLVAKYGRGHFVYTGPRVLPAAARRRARRLPALRQPGLARQMTLSDDDSTGLPHPPAHADEPPDEVDRPAVAATWPGVYLFVLGCFVTWVVLLVVLEQVFS